MAIVNATIHGRALANATTCNSYVHNIIAITFNAASCIISLLESLHIAGTVTTHSKSVQQKRCSYCPVSRCL